MVFANTDVPISRTGAVPSSSPAIGTVRDAPSPQLGITVIAAKTILSSELVIVTIGSRTAPSAEPRNVSARISRHASSSSSSGTTAAKTPTAVRGTRIATPVEVDVVVGTILPGVAIVTGGGRHTSSVAVDPSVHAHDARDSTALRVVIALSLLVQIAKAVPSVAAGLVPDDGGCEPPAPVPDVIVAAIVIAAPSSAMIHRIFPADHASEFSRFVVESPSLPSSEDGAGRR
mmetsp:Transcript_37357/g.78249  ORF Transcript_37357/g.78249 Transcript_37357/m.78249 type:complete len:231 (+) Transcript_37357:256-948(+)